MRFLLLFLLIPTLLQAETRTFTNNQGRAIVAEVVEINGPSVVLKMRGQNYPVPINSLSKEDQTYLKEWKSANETKEPEGNWDAPWPKTISADVSQDIEIIQEAEGEYIYASTHYEFHSNAKLNKSVVKRFALLFEATNQFMRELPLGMKKPFQEKRFKIELFERKSEYVSAGAPASSAGVYMSGKDIIMVPFQSLGLKQVGSAYSVDYKKENGTLSHEICHQLTDPVYYAAGSRGWFTEGLAEYIKCSGYRSGKFNVNDLKNLKEFVTGYGDDGQGGRAIGDDIRMPSFQKWANQSYSSFLSDPQKNYGMGALVVYYFFHMDQEKDAANIKAFLKKLQERKKGPEAMEALLNGRTFEELEDDISKAWRGRGVKISWGG